MAEVLHYRSSNDLSHFDPDHMLGPDLHRRYLTIKSTAYDPELDVCTATLRAVLPDEFRERVTPLIEQQRTRVRLRELFGG